MVLTVLAPITLLPALLGLFGRAGAQPAAAPPAGAPSRPGEPATAAAGAWAQVGGHVQRRPRRAGRGGRRGHGWSSPSRAVTLRLGSSDQGNDPASTTTRQAYDLLADGFGPGFNGPLVLVARPVARRRRRAPRRWKRACRTSADVASVRTLRGGLGH